MAKEEGMTVDWELKAVLVVGIYALLKVLGDIAKKDAFVTGSQAFFAIGHLLFFYFFMLANGKIAKQTGKTNDEKNKSKKACQLAFRNIMARALVIGFIHYRTKMMPPLYISVFMAFYTLIENPDFYFVIHSKFPKLFEVFF